MLAHWMAIRTQLTPHEINYIEPHLRTAIFECYLYSVPDAVLRIKKQANKAVNGAK